MSVKYGARVGANVRWLYLRLAVESATEIAAVRILLATLGVEGFGLFAAIAGSIGMVGFFHGSLQVAAHRFLCRDSGNFAPLLGLTLVLSGLMGLAGGVAAFVAFPSNAAVALFVLGVAIFQILRIPYEACIVASERMFFFLAVSIVESTLAIATAVLAGRLPFPPISSYAALRLASFALVGAIVAACCLWRHPFSRVRPRFSLGAARAMLGFFGWRALDSVAGLLKCNALIALLAVYKGVAGCAAWESTMKFSVLFWGLIANYRMAYLPGIVKSWTAGDRPAFVAGTHRAFLWSLAGMTFAATPFLAFAPAICRVCLGSADGETAMFLRMVALRFCFEALATPFDTAIIATGRIARYEIVLTAIVGSSFFLSWMFLAAGLPGWTTQGAVAFATAAALLYRLVFMRRVRMPDGTRAWS